MLWWLAGVLMVLGLVGLVTSYPMAGLISIALVLIRGKMPPVPEGED
jgi:hypothetical protein